MMKLIPLHVKTSFSLLESPLKIDTFIKEVKSRNIFACGITDNRTLMGYPEFYDQCSSNGLNPIFGMDLICDNQVLSLFIANETGYQNLIKLSYICSTKKNEDLTLDELKEHSQGLICVISSISAIFDEIKHENIAKYLFNLEKYFNSGFFVGIESYSENDSSANKVRHFLEIHPFEAIAFPFICYLKPEDQLKVKILDTRKNLRDSDLKNISNKSELCLNFDEDQKENGYLYYYSDEEFEKFYTQEEILATKKLPFIVNFEFNKKRGSIQKFSSDNDSKNTLRKLAFDGLNDLGFGEDERYKNRLESELQVIDEMGYNDYFLLVNDFVHYAKSSDILCGIRGSSNGALVTYCLHLSEVDPLKYNLFFERFLNKERISMPDIDIDIENNEKRAVIIDYIRKRFGEDKVSLISTITTIKEKQALQVIHDVFNLNDADFKYMSKLLVNDKYSLQESYENIQSFRDLINDDEYYLKIFNLAKTIEGLPFTNGLHAAGIVINSESLFNVLPVSFSQSANMNVSQFEKDHLEKYGFLKMDLLSVDNLNVIHNTIKLINENHAIDLKYENIDTDEEEIYTKIISKNLNIGFFQIDTTSMSLTIPKINPTSFNDLTAILALNRPGPMDMIGEYAKNKNSGKVLNYKNQVLKNILSETYGTIVYQEQIMQIAQQIAGFSLSKADVFRNAISKKKLSLIETLKSDFINGCLANGYTEKFAISLFDLINKFANYGFNKSHAVAYAKVTSKMAYLKLHYPKEFYISLLNSPKNEIKDNETKLSNFINELKVFGLKFEKPSINKSQFVYVMDENSIIIPFTEIKKVNYDTVTKIVACREKHSKFSGLLDFFIKITPYNIPENQFEALIRSGCLDEFCPNREAIYQNLQALLKKANILSKIQGSSIFNEAKEFTIDEMIYEDPIEKANYEKDYLGMYLSKNPISLLKEKHNIENTSIFSEFEDGKKYISIALLSKTKIINTKKKEQMAFVSFIDENNNIIEGTIFPKTYNQYASILKNGNIYKITGRCEKRNSNDKLSFVVETMETIKNE